MCKKEIYNQWKKEFFKIKELDYFNVYLVGTFNDYINDKFSNMDSDKKYTENQINNMSNKDLITLEKFQNLNYTDVDIVITDNSDIDKIKKVLTDAQKIETFDMFFDLKYQSCGVFQDYNTKGDYFDCEIIQYNSEKKVKLPFEKHEKIFEMGYEYFKPTLIKNKLL